MVCKVHGVQLVEERIELPESSELRPFLTAPTYLVCPVCFFDLEVELPSDAELRGA